MGKHIPVSRQHHFNLEYDSIPVI